MRRSSRGSRVRSNNRAGWLCRIEAPEFAAETVRRGRCLIDHSAHATPPYENSFTYSGSDAYRCGAVKVVRKGST